MSCVDYRLLLSGIGPSRRLDARGDEICISCLDPPAYDARHARSRAVYYILLFVQRLERGVAGDVEYEK